MAKGKPTKLSLEELLEQALVTEAEQPYEVPENWVWTRLGEVINLIGGGTPSKGVAAYWNGKIPWASVKDIKQMYLMKTEDYITEQGLEKSSTSLANEGDVILVTRISPGESAIAAITVAINQDLKIVQKKVPIPSQFLHKYFTLNKSKIESLASGTTVKGITVNKVQNMPFPIPPLTEQQRIVDRIESLFEKLDRAKELAQNALDSFENRKAAILHKAFTGELNRKWQEENEVEFARDWKEERLEQISELITKGASPRWQGIDYVDDIAQVLFITSENVREGYLDFTNRKYVEQQINTKQKRSILKYGDVLVNIVGASIGRAAIFNIERDANINQAVCLIRLNSKYLNEYLCYYLNSPQALKYYSENKVDVARANLSLKDISNISIPIPSLNEQQEIVRILDNLLASEQKAKELCDVLDKIEQMKKVILARAFRGEMGTNDPAEESAMELLKEVLKEKAAL